MTPTPTRRVATAASVGGASHWQVAPRALRTSSSSSRAGERSMRVIRRKKRGDEGAALVEFALIAPILFLLLFGLIDFGFIYNDFLQLRQGVRDGARQGAVANFGSDSTCSGLSTSSTSTQAKELLCATRNRIGLDS